MTLKGGNRETQFLANFSVNARIPFHQQRSIRRSNPWVGVFLWVSTSLLTFAISIYIASLYFDLQWQIFAEWPE